VIKKSASRIVASLGASRVPAVQIDWMDRRRWISKIGRPSQTEIGIRLAQLISRCKFFGPQFYVDEARARARARDAEKYSDGPNIRWVFPGESRQAWKNSRERPRQRKLNFAGSFIDANILFDLDRPRHASRPILSIRNNWPSAGPPSRDNTSQITEFQTRPSNFHIFLPSRDAAEISCAPVPQRYYSKIRKSARARSPARAKVASRATS